MTQASADAKLRHDVSLLAHAFRTIIDIYTEVAANTDPSAALPLLAWATADGAAAAARLAAVKDVEAPDSVLPDPPFFDLDRLRSGLHNVLGDADMYNELEDPRYEDAMVGQESITESILTAVSAYQVGLYYLDNFGPQAAMWWWQYSAMTVWADRIASALRNVLLLLSAAHRQGQAQLVHAVAELHRTMILSANTGAIPVVTQPAGQNA
ncbi:MAG: DUF5063 domain-containing protein [Bifidobacteriaceae bacterium]|jgi:hypothetical protein|nr:DUF5063 domain-containing protein [Bifidobacteriaceae bacterium]